MVDASPRRAIWRNDKLNLRKDGPSTRICSTRAGASPVARSPGRRKPCVWSKCLTGKWHDCGNRSSWRSRHPNWEPRCVYYRNPHRYTEHFGGGGLLAERNSVIERAANVTVELRKEGARLQSTATDASGEFKFDALPARSRSHAVHIAPIGAWQKHPLWSGDDSAHRRRGTAG